MFEIEDAQKINFMRMYVGCVYRVGGVIVTISGVFHCGSVIHHLSKAFKLIGRQKGACSKGILLSGNHYSIVNCRNNMSGLNADKTFERVIESVFHIERPLGLMFCTPI